MKRGVVQALAVWALLGVPSFSTATPLTSPVNQACASASLDSQPFPANSLSSEPVRKAGGAVVAWIFWSGGLLTAVIFACSGILAWLGSLALLRLHTALLPLCQGSCSLRYPPSKLKVCQ